LVQAGPKWRALVLASAAVLLLAGLGRLDADAPDEPRALQIAEELRSGEHGPQGLLVLHLNGEVYTQKPPLYYWLAALAGAPGGRVTELAARLPSALAGICVVWLTLLLGTRMLGGGAGVLGAAILLTSWEFAYLGRRVQFDVLLTAFELAALASFWWLDRGMGSARRHQLVLHGALGLAVLTKGPVGFLIPALTIAVFLLWERRPGDLRRAFPLWGLLLSVLPGLLWVAAATALAPAGYAGTALGENVIGRFFSGTSHVRPFWYYLWSFPVHFLPWTLAWPVIFWVGPRSVFAAGADDAAAGGARGDAKPSGAEAVRAWRFLLAGIATSLVFFSISAGKRSVYLLPIFPATALLTADALLRWLVGRARLPRASGIGAALVLVLLVAIGAEAIAAGLGRPFLVPAERLAELRAPYLLAFGCGLVGVALAGLAAGMLWVRNRVPAYVFPGLVAGTIAAVELTLFLLLLPALEPTQTLRPTAEAAGRHTPAGERIGVLGSRAMVGGLNYYGGRRVAVLRTPEDVERFFAEGGGALVLKRKKLERLEVPVEVVHTARSGRRELLVVTPRTASDAAERKLR
jgi:4-amino-4-deoxy-L-arabinose transferase-like glycosyltransferase